MKRLVLIDGNALLHRAYHATPPLSTSKGELINAAFGFTSMILKALNELKPDFIAIAWDKKDPTFRHQVYTQYKATRGPTDDGLSSQYERVHQIVNVFNIPEFSLSGYEADDLIGTLAKQAVDPQSGEKNLEVIILTGDRDIMQLIDQNIKVLMPKKTISDVGLYGIDEFVGRFGFSPQQLTDYKALAGDVSDNIKGVPGIGEVSATKLIKEFGSIEKLYKSANLKTLPERMQKLLAEGAESAVLSKTLATLELNAPIKLDLPTCRARELDSAKTAALFEELEFQSLVNRLPGNEARGGSKEGSTASTAILREPVLSGLRDELVESVEVVEGRGPSESSRTVVAQNQHTTDLDLAVIPVLEKMSEHGVLIDLGFLSEYGKQLKTKLKDAESGVYKFVGHQFNLNSPKQLSEVLFEEIKLPVIRKTKTGRSTDEATLHELSNLHPAVPLIVEYRQLFKLISTYVDALPKYADTKGRIHSTFNVEGAATGRLSSQNPNLQNIPVKGQLGGEIRKAFVVPKGKILLGADYSQIELRILAHLADDPGLKKAFQEGVDIHVVTAAKIFKVQTSEVTKEQRMVGKTMNFATLYGQGPHALSKQLGVDFETARVYIAEYFEQFPRVKEWMQKTLEYGYQNGYVETLWGRKRYIPELQSSNKGFKAFGERAAINHPIQGTSADMIKKAMVEIDKELSVISRQSSDKSHVKVDSKRSERSGSCSLILQVHDELLFECSPKDIESVGKMVRDKMENALILSVPVIADLKSGFSWGEMTPLDIKKTG